MTHEVVSKAKTEALHRIQTHYLPLYFPEVDRFRNNTRSDPFFALLERFPVPASITALSKDAFVAAAQVAIRQRENSFRAKFERYVAKDREDPDLRRKAFTAITAKMARVVHAIIKSGADYRPFVEGPVPGGRTPSLSEP